MKLTPDSEKYQTLYFEAWTKQNKIDGRKNPDMLKKDTKKETKATKATNPKAD